jgi:hypothetical protein
MTTMPTTIAKMVKRMPTSMSPKSGIATILLLLDGLPLLRPSALRLLGDRLAFFLCAVVDPGIQLVVGELVGGEVPSCHYPTRHELSCKSNLGHVNVLFVYRLESVLDPKFLYLILFVKHAEKRRAAVPHDRTDNDPQEQD